MANTPGCLPPRHTTLEETGAHGGEGWPWSHGDCVALAGIAASMLLSQLPEGRAVTQTFWADSKAGRTGSPSTCSQAFPQPGFECLPAPHSLLEHFHA